MSTLQETSANAILREAASHEIGIAVEIIADPSMIQPTLRAISILNRFKRENSDFADLLIRPSPENPDKEIWIFKKHLLKTPETQFGEENAQDN